MDQSNRQSVSMKHIARRVYNRCQGLAEPREEKLMPGQCFCCGERDHLRFQCPLKDKCLICGKSGHIFKNCHLLRNQSNRSNKEILCIHDEQNHDCETDVHLMMHHIDIIW